MTKYAVTWLDYHLPTGQNYTVAVCGYYGKVSHMAIGQIPLQDRSIKFIDVEDGKCTAGEHCLATSCPLNRTTDEHLAHMLDMPGDEPLDKETSKLWGTESTVQALIRFAQKIGDELPEEVKRQRLYEPE